MEEQKYKILLIEDDKLDQMAFRRFFDSEKLPYDYVIASSISEAQGILESARLSSKKSDLFDIIISDFMLPDGNAIELLKLVKDIPIVLTTGSSDEETAAEALNAGAYDYLAKDYDRDYLRALPRTIDNAISRVHY